MILRAKIVLPITAPPIEDGAVFVDGEKIRAVAPWKVFAAHTTRVERHGVRDLGEVILLPGLVNAHCHLDYTGMAGEIPPPKNFTDWIAAITAFKANWDFSDYAQSWLQGAHQLLETGCTTVLESLQDTAWFEALDEDFLGCVVEIRLTRTVVPPAGAKVGTDNRGVAADKLLAIVLATGSRTLNHRPTSR